MPADGLAIAKTSFALVEQTTAYVGEEASRFLVHAFATNLRFEDDEFNFVKTRAKVGTSEAFRQRDATERRLLNRRPATRRFVGAKASGGRRRGVPGGDRHRRRRPGSVAPPRCASRMRAPGSWSSTSTRTAPPRPSTRFAGSGPRRRLVVGDVSPPETAARAVADGARRARPARRAREQRRHRAERRCATPGTRPRTRGTGCSRSTCAACSCARGRRSPRCSRRGRCDRERGVDRGVGVPSVVRRTRRPRVRSSATPGTSRSELAERGVRVNCVSPGFMRTPMTTGERLTASTRRNRKQRLAGFATLVPMRRSGCDGRHRRRDPVPRQ